MVKLNLRNCLYIGKFWKGKYNWLNQKQLFLWGIMLEIQSVKSLIYMPLLGLILFIKLKRAMVKL